MPANPNLERVKDWWNLNSYSYGVMSKGAYRDVGFPDDLDMQERFAKYERKYRKHLAEAMDTLGRPGGRWIPLDGLKDMDVLDLACGLGWATVTMGRAGARVVSVDLTNNALLFTRKYAESAGTEAFPVQASAEQLPLSGERFDFVLGWGFIMHTPDPARALKEMVRVVRPGGRVVLYYYYKHSLTYWWHIFALRGVLSGQFVRYRGSRRALVSRYTDGQSIGGNPLTDVLTRGWFRRVLEDVQGLRLSFAGWGPPSLVDSFPISRLPLGKLLPQRLKVAWSRRFGFGQIVIIDKLPAI